MDKPIIGVLASHDSQSRNHALVDVLDYLVEKHPSFLEQFQFVITRGTFRRVIMGEEYKDRKWDGVREDTRDFLLNRCQILRLPCRKHGGIVLMTDLIVKRKMSIIWPFLTPTTAHWLTPENLALLRLSDHCHANRLMNTQSVIEWACSELTRENRANRQPVPPKFRVGGVTADEDGEVTVKKDEDDGSCVINWWDVLRKGEEAAQQSGPSLALIAHDEMKSRIEDFVTDYQNELDRFSRIITTGTTGKVVQDVAPRLADKVRRYNSGPKGGDIEIAVEMIFNRCQVAVFLVDPLSAHSHSEDIKVLFGAAILNRVRLLTNERQARAWMDRTGGIVNPCSQYTDWVKPRMDARAKNRTKAQA
jgi:methylglyoxal synthase